MELQQLRYLRSVVRTGSVTAAAEAEFVAQPSISKQLRQLERELGIPLLHRVGRGVEPTEAAIALAELTDRILDDLASTVAHFKEPGDGTGSTLRVAATETASDYLLPRVFAAWRREFPGARLSVEMLGTDAVVTEVLDGRVDIGVVALPLIDARLEVMDVLDEEVFAVVPRAHPLASHKTVKLDDVLVSEELLLSMRGRGLRALVEQTATREGVQLSSRTEIRSMHAILAMVAAGAGIALAPAMAMQDRDDVLPLRLEPPLRRRLGVTWRRGRQLSGVTRRFVALLSESDGGRPT